MEKKNEAHPMTDAQDKGEHREALEAARRIVEHQPNKHGWGYTQEVLTVARLYIQEYEKWRKRQ